MADIITTPIAKRWQGEDPGLKKLIAAISYDYERRADLLATGTPSRRVRMELAYLNSKILDAAAEIVGTRLASTFIDELGGGIGYAKSAVDCMSEVTYKKYKAEVACNIARKLYLFE